MLTNHQEKLYELYKEIDQICRKYNIDYQLAGGTLIGALRHRGFIPWDDDMDITMTRKHWNRFLEVCNNGALPENRVLECQENNRNYHNMVARYTDTTCTALHKTQLMHEDVAGFVIDILIYDALPNKEKALADYTRDLMLYSDLLNDSLVYSYRYRINGCRYFLYKLQMKFKGRDYVLSKLENRMSQYNEDECDYLVLHWGGIPLVFDKKTFGDSSVNVPIEDTVGQCPDRPFDYLVDHYGDEWMFIPPVTEQQSHEAVFDSDIPYPVMRKEIYHFVTRKATKRKYNIRKNIALTHMNRWQNLKDIGQHIVIIGNNMEFNQTLKENREKIEKYSKEKNYIELRNIFSGFITFQNDRNTSGRGDYSGAYRYFNPILMDIPDDMFELVIATLFNTNSISTAKRFIEVYEYAKESKTPYMTELESDILKFRQAVSHFAAKEFNEAIPLIDQLYNKYPMNISIIKLKINQLLKLTDISKTYNEIISLSDKGLALSPDDGELVKYKLDASVNMDKTEKLIGYLKAWDKTLNGLTRLDIMDIVKDNLDFYLDYCDKCLGIKKNINKNSENNYENAEEVIKGSILPENMVETEEDYISLIILNKLNEILQDNTTILNKRFEILSKMAEKETDPIFKAKAQYRLISELLELRLYYIEKFIKNEYRAIETLITKWYYRYYKSINHSDFVTLTSAELIATEAYNNFEVLLDRLDNYMKGLEKTVPEYMYCLELRGEILYNMGESEAAYKIFCRCAMENNQPYLTVVLQDKFKNDISNIYKSLLASHNKGFIQKSLEGSGLTNEEYYLKIINNKKRLLDFYRERIQRVYPTAVYYIDILTKIQLLTPDEAKDIISKQKIKKGTKLGLRVIKTLHKTIIGYDPEIEDDGDFLEEITENSINFHHTGKYSRSVTD